MILTLGAFLIRTLFVAIVAQGVLWILRDRSAAARHIVVASSLTAILLLGIGAVMYRPKEPVLLKTRVVIRPILSNHGGTELFNHWAPAGAFRRPDLEREDIAVGIAELAYVAIAATLVLRVFFGLAVLGRKVSRSKLVKHEHGINVLFDETADSPSTAWWGRSVVLLPIDSASWPTALTEDVLAHEVAHIRRADWWWNLVGLLAVAIAWPNPLVWFLHRQCRELSEIAVDDSIVQSGTQASRYAQHLLQVATDRPTRHSGLVLPMAARPQLSKRIETLMKTDQRRGAATLAGVVGIGAVQALIVSVLANWGFVAKSPFEILLSSTRPASTAARVPKIFTDEKWYVLDISKTSSSPNVTMQAMNEAEITKMLRERQGKEIGRDGSHLMRVPGPKEPITSRIDPKDVTGKAGFVSGSRVNYREAVLLRSGMFEVNLEARQAGSKSWNVYSGTLSAGSSFDWLLKDSRPLCVFAPPVGNKQLVIVHTFHK